MSSKITLDDLLEAHTRAPARGTRIKRCGKSKQQDGGSKTSEWFVKAGKYIKDKKLVSKGLKGISGFLPGPYGVAAAAAGSVADMAGYGLTVPGGGKCMCRCVRTQPVMRLQQGTGLSIGSGLTLAGDRYQPMHRARVIPADCTEELRGSGRIIGNRTF